MKETCIFCKIANNTMESATIFENSEFKVILDVFPAAKGHTLIIPKQHVENIYEIDAETAGRLFTLATEVARALKKVYKCDGMNILQNNGKVAGQTVFHFHLHLIPRFNGDGINFKWETKKYTKEELDAIATSIASEI